MDKVLAITGATGKSGGSFLSVLMRNNKQIMNCFGGGGTPSCSVCLKS